MSDHRFSKELRLLRASDFEQVFKARNSKADQWIILYGAANGLAHARLGLAVSKRIGGAVQRNRWKRLVREAFRLTQHELPPLDLVCIARGESPPELDQLMKSIRLLTRRIQDDFERARQRCQGEGP
jgi:ribonuclease P protein component